MTESDETSATHNTSPLISFLQLFRLEDIQLLQDRFASATGVASIITLPDGTPITAPSNFRRLCSDIIRQSEAGFLNFKHSDAVIGRHHPQGPVVQPCLSGGLWDAGACITIDGIHLANWLIGQVRSEELDESSMLAYADEIGVDREEFASALKEVPTMSREQFQRVADALFILADEVSQNAWLNLQQRQLIEKQRLDRQLLQESEERFKALSDATFGGVIIHDQGTILECNQGLTEMTGFSYQELIGMNGLDLIAPESLETVLTNIRSESSMRYEVTGVRKDGSKYPLSIKGKNVLYQGREVQVIEFRDITALKLAGVALQRSERRYRLLFENMIAGFALHEMIYDANGHPNDYRYLEVNPAFEKLTGIKASEIVGRTVKEVMPLTEQHWIDTYGRVVQSGEPTFYENFAQEIGRYFDVWAFSPEVNTFAVVFIDTTERKENEQLVAAKTRELEQIIYVASHDLRSPLVNVDGYGRELEHVVAEMDAVLKTDGINPIDVVASIRAALPEIHDALRHIRSSTKQMDALLKGLLRISRLGRATLTPTPLEMNSLLSEVLASHEFRRRSAGIHLDLEELPPCRGDEVQLSQVFANLIDNAFKYLDPQRPGRVRISGTVENGRCIYCVEDNGIGIAPVHHARIFELFHRLDPKKTDGEGLGLTIIQQILARLDGKIWLESEPGVGSRFYVALPPVKRNARGMNAFSTESH